MAQELTFISSDTKYIFSSTKVDRSKIYGSTEKVILDNKDEACKIVSMDDSGTVIIPKGGVTLGIIDDEMNWVQRSQLHVVDLDGQAVEQIPSSFSVPIQLDQKVDFDTFLDHSITTVYQLEGDCSALVNKLGNDIYMFNFNYRNSYETNPAFLISNENGLFMLVGYKNDFEFINLQETAIIDTDESNEDTDDFDIDFSMM